MDIRPVTNEPQKRLEVDPKEPVISSKASDEDTRQRLNLLKAEALNLTSRLGLNFEEVKKEIADLNSTMDFSKFEEALERWRKTAPPNEIPLSNDIEGLRSNRGIVRPEDVEQARREQERSEQDPSVSLAEVGLSDISNINVFTNTSNARVSSSNIEKEDEEDEEEIERKSKAEMENEFNEFMNSKLLNSRAWTVPDDKFEELAVPSKNLFYDGHKVMARKLPFSSMRKLYRVFKLQQPNLLIEALSPCVNIPVEMLTQGDFLYLMYWLRTVSLPRSPLSFTWVSRYGTNETMNVDKSILVENRISFTNEVMEELKSFENLRKIGLTMPRTFDTILKARFDIEDNPNLEDWALGLSEMLFPLENETVEGRLNRLENYLEDNVEDIESFQRFKSIFTHGVDETVEVQADPKKFNPKEASVFLRKQAETLLREAENLNIFDAEINKEAESLVGEADEIEKTLSEGGWVIPRVEKRQIQINPLSFFPSLQ